MARVNQTSCKGCVSVEEQVPARYLDRLPIHSSAYVDEVELEGVDGERLLEMGLIPGTLIKLIRRGLFGSPIQVEVRGFMLTLRKSEAARVRLRTVP
jgi:ferrous iron transport protein A